LRLTPDAILADAPPLDVLHVPGRHGQEALMDDAEVLNCIPQLASGACGIFSVCTGALICGAAGRLKGRRATSHWASFHLLPYFGAVPVNERAVVITPGSLPRASQPASTAPCASPLRCTATKLPKQSSFTSFTAYAPGPANIAGG
jgi:cyclohexyl-isocyanide hydratase